MEAQVELAMVTGKSEVARLEVCASRMTLRSIRGRVLAATTSLARLAMSGGRMILYGAFVLLAVLQCPLAGDQIPVVIDGMNCIIDTVSQRLICQVLPTSRTYRVQLPANIGALQLENNNPGVRLQLNRLVASRPDLGSQPHQGEYCVQQDDIHVYCPENGLLVTTGCNLANPPCARTISNAEGCARPGQPGVVTPYFGEVACALKSNPNQPFRPITFGNMGSTSIGLNFNPGSKIYFGGCVNSINGTEVNCNRMNFRFEFDVRPVVASILPLRLPQFDKALPCGCPDYLLEYRQNTSTKKWRILSANVYAATGTYSEVLNGSVEVSIRNIATGQIIKYWHEKTGFSYDISKGPNFPLPIVLTRGGNAMVQNGILEIPPMHQIEIAVAHNCSGPARWDYAVWFNYYETNP